MSGLFKQKKVPAAPAVPQKSDPDIQAKARAEEIRMRMLGGLASMNQTGGTLGNPDVLSTKLKGY